MAYYHILKQRRLDLNLSVQDICIQTRLKPEYIRAIEENQLDIFSDDFSYVRYFVHAYCDAIGVNWKVIQSEVDLTIQQYAAARDRAISDAQAKMIQSIPNAKQTRKSSRSSLKKRSRKAMQNSAGRISRFLDMNSSNRLTKILILIAAAGITVLIAASSYLDSQSARMIQQQKIEKQQELKKKEEQTQKMADELRSATTQQTAPVIVPASITAVPDRYNEFEITGVYADAPLQLSISTAASIAVHVYVNQTPVYSQTVYPAAAVEIPWTQDGLITVYTDPISASTSLYVNGTQVEINNEALAEYPDEGIMLTMKQAAPAASDQQGETAQ